MRDRLPRERYRHCLSVARSAEKLAARHGAAAFKARVAGVLHDVARMWSADDLLTYASTHGLSVSENERAYPVLLHAPVGADIARREFGIDDVEILGAISRHTVAGPGMSGLEKIVYEADTFEPGRAFPGRARLEAAALRSLDGLRIRLLELINYAQHGAPWGLRWGLYSGNAILPDAKHLYFRRFQYLLLNNLDHSLLSRLAVLPETPGANDTYQPALDILKIHLMISSGACNPKPVFVARMLRRTLNDALPAASSERRTLEEKQIDFYANQLPDDANLCRIIDSPATTEHAREYLRHVRGPERTYPGLLSAVHHKFPHPQRLSDLAPNYSKVLSGPNQVDGAFSRNSWNFVEDSLKQRNGAPPDEVCVTGQAQGLIVGSKQDAELTRNLEGIFVRDYAEHWRKFVAGFSVVRYSGPADAARKLEILSDHKSPLLAVLAMTSNQTNFAPPAPEASLLRVGAGDTAEHPAEAQSNPAQITRLFQPVHVAVPPGSDTWVVQANSGYIDALAELGHAMQVIAEGGGDPGSAVYQSARQSYERALNSARQIAKGFKPVGVEGLDLAVQKLLYAPIRMTEAFIVRDLESDLKKRLEIGLSAGIRQNERIIGF